MSGPPSKRKKNKRTPSAYQDRNPVVLMNLSCDQWGEFALCTPIYLALHRLQVIVGKIAAYFMIPRNSLVKRMHPLGKLDYSRIIRGKNGGLLPKQDAREMHINDAIQAMAQQLERVNCHALYACPMMPNLSYQHLDLQDF